MTQFESSGQVHTPTNYLKRGVLLLDGTFAPLEKGDKVVIDVVRVSCNNEVVVAPRSARQERQQFDLHQHPKELKCVEVLRVLQAHGQCLVLPALLALFDIVTVASHRVWVDLLDPVSTATRCVRLVVFHFNMCYRRLLAVASGSRGVDRCSTGSE